MKVVSATLQSGRYDLHIPTSPIITHWYNTLVYIGVHEDLFKLFDSLWQNDSCDIDQQKWYHRRHYHIHRSLLFSFTTTDFCHVREGDVPRRQCNIFLHQVPFCSLTHDGATVTAVHSASGDLSIGGNA